MFNGVIERFLMNKPNMFYIVALSGFFFFLVVAELTNSFLNAEYIASLELLFILFYIFSFKNIESLKKAFATEKRNIFLLVLWAASVLYSFFNSYPDIVEFYLAFNRLYQTFMHVLFFITCWSLLSKKAINNIVIFVVIALTSLVVVVGFIWHWYQFPFLSSSQWVNNPPFNSNIRHSGYQLVAAIGFFLVLFIENKHSKLRVIAQFLLLSLLLGLLFWMGGRGAIFSVLAVILFYIAVAQYKNYPVIKFVITVSLAIALGFLLSELAVLYSWNGVTGSLERSVNSATINQLSSSRLEIWSQTWDVYKSNIIWGLGPQGFLGITTFRGIIHPHNVILQFLIEWGAVGSILFIALLVRGYYAGFVKNVLDTKELNMATLGGGGVILALSVHSLVDGTFYHPQPSVYLAFSYALWLQTPSSKN